MDDMFGMLYSDLDPMKKLLTIVSNNNMLDSLDKLIKDGVDINGVVQLQNGNTALHIAAYNGFFSYVQKLIESGADADKENSFGFTPLALALRQGQQDHAKCIKYLLQNGTTLTDPNIIWQSQSMGGTPTWTGYTPECLKILINASPNLTWFDEPFVDYLSSRSSDLIRYFLVAGNRISATKIGAMAAVTADVNHAAWLKSYQHRCHSLQHYARVAIRRTLTPNVLAAYRQLPIPPKIQEYLLITSDSVKLS